MSILAVDSRFANILRRFAGAFCRFVKRSMRSMIKGSFAKEACPWRDSSISNGFLVSKITVVLFHGSN